ncbi:TPA: tyrosine-type DNA invertase [Serratia marcescens]
MSNYTTPIKRKYLNESEVVAILSALSKGRNSERNTCIAYLCFIHGFRVSEVCNLRLSDVNLIDKNIFVRRLKNGFTTTHPLLDEEVKILDRWLNIREKFASSASDWLFLSRGKNRISRQQLHSIISRAGRDAGLMISIHPHMLRHSCGFALANIGIDTRLIQDYLGHKNIRHTVWYTASNPDRFHGIWKVSQRKYITALY